MGLQDVAAGLGDGGAGAGVLAQPGHEVSSLFFRLPVLGRGDQRAVDGGAGGNEGTPRPPQVQRGDVALADGFLPPRLGGDGFDGDIVFDQATIVGWHFVVQFLLYLMHAQYSANSRISQKTHQESRQSHRQGGSRCRPGPASQFRASP